MKSNSDGAGSRLLLWGTLFAVGVGLLGGLAAVLAQGQRASADELIERFHVRAEVAARFLSSYVEELSERERAVAAATLAGPDVSARDFEAAVANFAFPAAVLLDAQGKALHVFPANPALTGAPLAARYDHLRRAVDGEVAISGVVPSAVEGVPVVAFAVPFDSVAGRRVFSGAMAIADTSLGAAYLSNVLPLPGARAYLVDSARTTIASSVSPRGGVLQMSEVDPALHAVVASGRGEFVTRDGREQFVSVPIDATGWSLVVAVPEASLLLPLEQSHRWVPWALFAALAGSLALVGLLLVLRARSQAVQLAELERVSITDPLTGLYNRRGFEVLAEQELRTAEREATRAMVMFLDVDGLKAVNDSRGHEAGNRAIVIMAEVLREALRDADIVARVGGDEFCVLARVTGEPPDLDGMIARVERTLATRTADTGAPLGVSVGVSWFDPSAPRPLAELLVDADARMYREKQGHRSRG